MDTLLIAKTKRVAKGNNGKTEFSPIRPKLLIVEDNAFTQRYLQELLGILECSADFAEDGETALALYHQDYRLILMDIHLPDISGIVVTQTIRAMEKGRRVPIIAITSDWDDSECQKQCLSAGINHVSNKPTLAELKNLIETYVME